MALFTTLAVILVSLACPCVAADKALHLTSYSEDEVNGCYKHNQTLGVCFDVKTGSVKIEKPTGEDIAVYKDLGQDMVLYQVLDQAFVGRGPSVFYAPAGVPRNPEALRAFLDEIKDQEDLKNHYQIAMWELHHVPEVKLLERASAALGEKSTGPAILRSFHVLCLNLLKSSDTEIPDELRAAPDMEDDTADHHDRQKRGCRKPKKNNCRGLCGKGCSCWWWVCGDCCSHTGCKQHDLCCKKDFYSSYCLFPYHHGFKCSRFPGYPRCLKSWWG